MYLMFSILCLSCERLDNIQVSSPFFYGSNIPQGVRVADRGFGTMRRRRGVCVVPYICSLIGARGAAVCIGSLGLSWLIK